MQQAAALFQLSDPILRNNPELYREVSRNAVAFAGSMRTNLCNMFDELGLGAHLGLQRCAMMFDGHDSSIAMTSALVFLVFVGPKLANYSGSGRPLDDVPLFRVMLETLLQPQLQAAPTALIFPLGHASATDVRYLVSTQDVDERRVLFDFPHPSGANGHRKVKFEAAPEGLAMKLGRWFAQAKTNRTIAHSFFALKRIQSWLTFLVCIPCLRVANGNREISASPNLASSPHRAGLRIDPGPL